MDTVTDLNDGQVDEKMDNAIYGFAYDEDSPSQALSKRAQASTVAQLHALQAEARLLKEKEGRLALVADLTPDTAVCLALLRTMDSVFVAGGEGRGIGPVTAMTRKKKMMMATDSR